MAADARAELFLPGPDAFYEFFTAQVVAGFSFLFEQASLDNALGSNSRMVHPGEPESIEAGHALAADQNILQGAVQSVAQMQSPGDIRRRNHDAVSLGLGAILSPKASLIQPKLVDIFLDLLRVVNSIHLKTHK